jgi:hypothetical protein
MPIIKDYTKRKKDSKPAVEWKCPHCGCHQEVRKNEFQAEKCQHCGKRSFVKMLANGKTRATLYLEKEPRHKEKKFKSEKALWEWIKRMAHKRILFFDKGQDLQDIWIDDQGEIIHSNLQQSIWCGKFINLKKLGTDKHIEMLMDGKWKPMDFKVEEIVH